MIDKDKLMEYLIVTDQVDEFLGYKVNEEKPKTKALEYEKNNQINNSKEDD